MKRIFTLLAVALLAVGAVFAEEAILIDFGLLTADVPAEQATSAVDRRDNYKGREFFQNLATLMSFTNEGKSNFTSRQARSLVDSLAIRNWDVVLNSSAQTVNTKRYSYTEEAISKEFGPVLGVRANFPTQPYNASVRIVPPFEIPAFEPQIDGDTTLGQTPITRIIPAEGSNGITDRSRFEGNEGIDLENSGNNSVTQAGSTGEPLPLQRAYGVVKNVGVIKSLAVNVYGLNYPHYLSIILIDHNGKEKIYPIGTLDFEGWGELVWNNPQYVTEVRNRSLKLNSLYPQGATFVKFGGFIVQKDADAIGGDFITYFKDVKIIYDKAVLDEAGRDIQDEALWDIVRNQEARRRAVEMQRIGQRAIQRLLEIERQSVEDYFTRSLPGPDAVGLDFAGQGGFTAGIAGTNALVTALRSDATRAVWADPATGRIATGAFSEEGVEGLPATNEWITAPAEAAE
ncbi:MAG: flagellar filament outer layer protein FlaA [Treponema sp.]|jgi:hypothetical protein|nr:flagellar filament outer layer protein FlaA [Treponema sp.]